MEDVKLHGFWPSPFSQRVVWALKLKGVSYEYFPEELENKSELLLQYNPVYKKVPVLVHGGKPITESLVILEYIDETWPQNPVLLPKDPHERANIRFWAKFIDDQVRPMFAFFKLVGEEREKAIAHNWEVLRIIEEHGLGGDKKFFGGYTLGLADITLGWLVHTFIALEEISGIKFVTADTFPRLHFWSENFKAVPEIKDNLPEHDKVLSYFSGRREFWMKSGGHHMHN